MSVPLFLVAMRGTCVQEVVVLLGAIAVSMSEVVASGSVEVAPSRVRTCETWNTLSRVPVGRV